MNDESQSQNINVFVLTKKTQRLNFKILSLKKYQNKDVGIVCKQASWRQRHKGHDIYVCEFVWFKFETLVLRNY